MDLYEDNMLWGVAVIAWAIIVPDCADGADTKAKATLACLKFTIYRSLAMDAHEQVKSGS